MLNVSSVPSPAGQAQVFFSGYTWSVRSDYAGPGPNQFSAANVWVDENGYLHLRVSKDERGWTAAEAVSTSALGFGTYEFGVLGDPAHMDRHVTLALFNYGSPAVGPDETNEIDVEFRLFDGARQQETWSVWPTKYGVDPSTHAFVASALDMTTQRFAWSSDAVRFAAFDAQDAAAGVPYEHWLYAPEWAPRRVPQHPMAVHLELALTGGPPTDDEPFEMVITRFAFTPEK